ncbi:MAG TPA: TylF/MycF/NovP-related O-methyltransferase [Stellaceae bacterium]|nr:TylF/MycF/NovP-related O-methyltransferase [Stellaceae bacterium]
MSYGTEKLKIILRDHVLPGFVFRLRAALQGVPDARLYAPTFEPWRGLPEFQAVYDEVKAHTLLGAERVWILYALARQALAVDGDFLEAGVYRGGTARLLRRVAERAGAARHLHLFDTFAGMPKTDPQRDKHRERDFLDTSLESVSKFVAGGGEVEYHAGLIPDTFRGLEDNRFAFAHIDVDIYRSVADCCAFVYPRTTQGGIILFDDYGFPSCPGARQAVDEFFADKPEYPLVLATGQAVVIRANGNG